MGTPAKKKVNLILAKTANPSENNVTREKLTLTTRVVTLPCNKYNAKKGKMSLSSGNGNFRASAAVNRFSFSQATEILERG